MQREILNHENNLNLIRGAFFFKQQTVPRDKQSKNHKNTLGQFVVFMFKGVIIMIIVFYGGKYAEY